MSEKIEHAVGLATALSTAETSANQAMIDMLAVGTAMFRARQCEAFHNLECQRGVELFGTGVAKMTEGLGGKSPARTARSSSPGSSTRSSTAACCATFRRQARRMGPMCNRSSLIKRREHALL